MWRMEWANTPAPPPIHILLYLLIWSIFSRDGAEVGKGGEWGRHKEGGRNVSWVYLHTYPPPIPYCYIWVLQGRGRGIGRGVKEYPNILTSRFSPHSDIVVSADLVHFLQGWGGGTRLGRLGVWIFHHIIVRHLSLILRHIWVWLTST